MDRDQELVAVLDYILFNIKLDIKKGSNAVSVANRVLNKAEDLKQYYEELQSIRGKAKS